MRNLVLLLILIITSGCAGETRFTRTGDKTYEILLKDNGFMAMLNSSRLEMEWSEAAQELCPGGYAVLNRIHVHERAFEPAELTGTVMCE